MTAEPLEALLERKQTLIPKTGVPVQGAEYWNRPREMLELITRLESGGSVSLFGLRRIGKSSMMHEAARHLRTRGHTCIFLNTEGMSGAGRLLVDIVRGLDPRLLDRITTAWVNNGSLNGALKTIAAIMKKEPVDTANQEKHFRDFWEPLTQTVEKQLRDSEQKVFVFIDELPFFLADQLDKGVPKQNIIDVLATLRRWRQDGAIMSQVLCGSIGMAGFLRLHDIDRDHNNDAPGIYIGPLGRIEAAAFLNALARGSDIDGWSDAVAEAVLDESIEFYPSYLQEVMLHLRTEALMMKYEAGTISPSPLIEALRSTVMPKIRRGFEVDFFNQFDKRLARLAQFGENWADIAQALLLTLHRHKTISRSDLERRLKAAGIDGLAMVDFIEILREDAFVTEDAHGNTVFGDRIVEAWLTRRHGKSL